MIFKEKRRYKIAILIDQLIFGGVQKIAIEDARNFEKLGHEATLLVLMRKGANKNYKSYAKGVNVKFLSDSYPWPFSKSIKFPIFSFFSTLHILSPFLAPFNIKRGHFDIIVSHGTTTCFTAQGLKFFNNIPYIAFIHDPMNYILKTAYSNSPLRKLFPFMKPLLAYLEKKLIEQSEKVILDSKLHQEFISKTYKIKSIVLPAGTDIPKQITNNDKNYILAATRWEKNKNPELLLKLAKDIPDLNIKIAGSWTSNKQYQEFTKSITENGLTGKISLYPEISENDLKKLYRSARIYIHPIKEAFGLGGLEASANGCPIVIPKGSGVTNYLNNNEDGIFVQNQNYENFLEAVKKLWFNPQLAQKMGISAHQKVKTLSWKNHTRKLLEIVNTCLTSANTTIVALETGHASESYLSGGDKLLEKMAYYFSSSINVKILIPEIGIKHWQEARLKNVELITLPKTIFDNNPKPFFVFIAYIFRIINSYLALRKLKIDFVYSSTNVLPDIAPAFLFKLTKNILWISRVHHLIHPPTKRPGSLIINIVSYLMQSLSNFMMRTKSDKIIALNEVLKNLLIKKNFDPKKLVVLGAGIDFEEIRRSKTVKKLHSDAIFVGRLHPTKGIYDLVDIWNEVTLQKPDAKALIVGGGTLSEINKINGIIKNNNLQKNLKLTGYLPEPELFSALKSSKIFLFTDYEAGWGLAIAEAMAAGLPVVGYNLDIFGNVFKKGYITVPIGNKNIFAEKIINLLDHPNKYNKLKTGALEQARLLSWEKTSREFQKIIENLID